MSGKLYVVGTPIGNLSDFSPRAVETLASVDFIAAEDTRVTLKLLNHFEIKKPMVSYFEHNRTFNSLSEKLTAVFVNSVNRACCVVGICRTATTAIELCPAVPAILPANRLRRAVARIVQPVPCGRG